MRLSRADEIKAKEIAKKYNLAINDVKAIILSQYEFIRETVKKIDIPDETTEEEFKDIKTNFNIPSLGKLYASHYLWRKIIDNKNKSNENREGDK